MVDPEWAKKIISRDNTATFFGTLETFSPVTHYRTYQATTGIKALKRTLMQNIKPMNNTSNEFGIPIFLLIDDDV